MSDTITVKNKGMLIDLLRSGGRYESIGGDEVSFQNTYDDSVIGSPFREWKNGGTERAMYYSWGCKQWRNVKYQPKHNEVVLAWDDDFETVCVIGVFNAKKNAIQEHSHRSGSLIYQNYAPYTGTMPPHIQKFLDELEG